MALKTLKHISTTSVWTDKSIVHQNMPV